MPTQMRIIQFGLCDGWLHRRPPASSDLPAAPIGRLSDKSQENGLTGKYAGSGPGDALLVGGFRGQDCSHLVQFINQPDTTCWSGFKQRHDLRYAVSFRRRHYASLEFAPPPALVVLFHRLVPCGAVRARGNSLIVLRVAFRLLACIPQGGVNKEPTP
jgi:hypothetical protein